MMLSNDEAIADITKWLKNIEVPGEDELPAGNISARQE